MVVWLFTNTDHSLVLKRHAEVLQKRWIWHRQWCQERFLCEKAAARCRPLLQRRKQQKFLDATWFDSKESLQKSKIDAFLIRRIQAALRLLSASAFHRFDESWSNSLQQDSISQKEFGSTDSNCLITLNSSPVAVKCVIYGQHEGWEQM